MPIKKNILVVPSVVELRLDPSQTSFTIPQVAAYTGLTQWQVRMAIWQGRLAAKRVGKSLIVLRQDVNGFLEALPTVSLNEADWLRNRQAVR